MTLVSGRWSKPAILARFVKAQEEAGVPEGVDGPVIAPRDAREWRRWPEAQAWPFGIGLVRQFVNILAADEPEIVIRNMRWVDGQVQPCHVPSSNPSGAAVHHKWFSFRQTNHCCLRQ